ncbi:MAG: deoxyribose-phosphate aldolase [Bacteroidota bacterium]
MNEVSRIAGMIDHSALHPTLTDEALRQACAVAKEYAVASICIKPYAVALAAELLKDSPVKVCTVVGFPHGSSTTHIKVLETRQACEAGAEEIDMVVNVGKVLSEDWAYVQDEIAQIQAEVTAHKAILKVIFETDFVTREDHKIKLCEICSTVGVAYVKTSTGFGFVKGADGTYSYQGATEADLKLMRSHSASTVGVKASGGVRTWEAAQKVVALGATRIGASATEAILTAGQKAPGIEGY